MGLIVPGKGETKQVVQRLLGLADNPADVATTMDGPDGISFVVPDELYDRYLNTDVVEASTDSPAAEVVDEGLPAPKRRGRPPGSKNKAKEPGTEE